MGVVSWATGDGVLKRSDSDTGKSHQDGAGPSKCLNYAASVSRAHMRATSECCLGTKRHQARVVPGDTSAESAKLRLGSRCLRLQMPSLTTKQVTQAISDLESASSVSLLEYKPTLIFLHHCICSSCSSSLESGSTMLV